MLQESDLSNKIAECGCGILVQDQNITDNSTDTKCWIMDHEQSDQPFLVAIRGPWNTIGHFVELVQNMIVDATLTSEVQLSS